MRVVKEFLNLFIQKAENAEIDREKCYELDIGLDLGASLHKFGIAYNIFERIITNYCCLVALCI